MAQVLSRMTAAASFISTQPRQQFFWGGEGWPRQTEDEGKDVACVCAREAIIVQGWEGNDHYTGLGGESQAIQQPGHCIQQRLETYLTHQEQIPLPLYVYSEVDLIGVSMELNPK